MPLSHDEGWAIPWDFPHYPPLPAIYRNTATQMVFFEADPAAVARMLPEPLEPSPDGLCVAMGIRIPFCTAYGPFNEAALEQKCLFRGQVGWYCSHAWHDGPRGIAAGREVYGTPKIFSELDIQLRESTMVTRASVGGVPNLTISSTMEAPVDPAEIPALAPSWRLKIIPRADRPGPAIKQLVDAGPAESDSVVHVAYRGRGTVHFEPAALLDVTGLSPRRLLDAYYVESSYAEGFGVITYDYLAGG